MAFIKFFRLENKTSYIYTYLYLYTYTYLYIYHYTYTLYYDIIYYVYYQYIYQSIDVNQLSEAKQTSGQEDSDEAMILAIGQDIYNIKDFY